MTPVFTPLLILLLLASGPACAEEEHGANQQGIPQMTAEQRQAMGIVTTPVSSRRLVDEIIAPGEVTLNAYRTSQVTSRISAQVIKRYARMGEQVKSGQKLLRLSSVAMAEAQGQMLIADREWRRVNKLGRKVVSGRRYIDAQVKRQEAYAKVLAYGMTNSQISALLKQNDASKATGAFDLLSPQDGTVISDSFLLGQVVKSGQLLMEISDETLLWVETQINPADVINIKPNATVRILAGGSKWLNGKVVQIHRRIDETTRTLPVRIQVDNKQGLLRPGQFVKTALQTETSEQVIAVPTDTVTLLHGDQVVFLLEGDELHPQLVETGRVRDGWIGIKKGLKQGDKIVTKGMFLLKSLLLKSQIGDEH